LYCWSAPSHTGTRNLNPCSRRFSRLTARGALACRLRQTGAVNHQPCRWGRSRPPPYRLSSVWPVISAHHPITILFLLLTLGVLSGSGSSVMCNPCSKGDSVHLRKIMLIALTPNDPPLASLWRAAVVWEAGPLAIRAQPSAPRPAASRHASRHASFSLTMAHPTLQSLSRAAPSSSPPHSSPFWRSGDDLYESSPFHSPRPVLWSLPAASNCLQVHPSTLHPPPSRHACTISVKSPLNVR
jgi:hypothetical protein